jgi:hypothetical protein
MSHIIEDHKRHIMTAVQCINVAIGWVALDGKPKNVSGLVFNLRSSIHLLTVYAKKWRSSLITKGSAQTEGGGDDLGTKVVIALIQAVPEDTTDSEFSSSGTCYNWYEDNASCARRFLRLLTQLLDSVRKQMFSQKVAAMAELEELQECTGANFTDGGQPWGADSVDLVELRSFMHTFASKLTVAFSEP